VTWVGSTLQVGIVARDVPAMLAFYRDVLALPRAEPMPLGKAMTLHCFDVGEARIKIGEAAKPPAAAAPDGGFGGATGIRWLTLETDDLAAVVARCEAAGCRFPMAVQESARTPGLRFGIVADPDGNWIEMLQRPD
jgi:catechol 2,3-dioxygenase-like lactoylglutathione lyase family enzyme